MPYQDLDRLKASNVSVIKANMHESMEDSVADLLRPQNQDDFEEENESNSIRTEIEVDNYNQMHILNQQEPFFEQLAQQNRNYGDYYAN